MTARIKEVQPTDMVAHLWAHQTQEHARNGAGRDYNFYFNGDTIYSYGSHFPIARHVTNKRGEAAVLMTTKGYSSTTGGHIWSVKRAVGHLTVFNIENVVGTKPADEMARYGEKLAKLATEYEKSRTRKPEVLARIIDTVKEANLFASFFGIKRRFKQPAKAEEMLEECKGIAKKNADAKRRAIRAEERKKQEAVDKWVRGETDQRPYHTMNGEVRLRVKGDVVETTMGAQVPLTHAVKAFKAIKTCHDKKKTFETNGRTIRLGNFRIDRIDEEGNVVAGCHHIKWSEIERVAKLQGII